MAALPTTSAGGDFGEGPIYGGRGHPRYRGRRGGKGSVVGEKQKRSWGTSQFLLATGEACASAFWF